MSAERRIGDRIERAVGQRADVEHEIERGEAEQPAGRSLRRTLVWLTITAVSLYLVAPSLFEVLGSWNDVDHANGAGRSGRSRQRGGCLDAKRQKSGGIASAGVKNFFHRQAIQQAQDGT